MVRERAGWALLHPDKADSRPLCPALFQENRAGAGGRGWQRAAGEAGGESLSERWAHTATEGQSEPLTPHQLLPRQENQAAVTLGDIAAIDCCTPLTKRLPVGPGKHLRQPAKGGTMGEILSWACRRKMLERIPSSNPSPPLPDCTDLDEIFSYPEPQFPGL